MTRRSSPAPDMPESVTRSLYEHEVLLSFNSDSEALDFRDFITGAGWQAFVAWREQRAEER